MMKNYICVIIFLLCIVGCGKKERTIEPIVILEEQIDNESQKLKNDTISLQKKDSVKCDSTLKLK